LHQTEITQISNLFVGGWTGQHLLLESEQLSQYSD
jgi:hypothetical protein